MIETFSVTNAGTVYRIHVASISREGSEYPAVFFMLETGWGSGYGEWIRLDVDSIAWTYLAEKMPEMARREGDKPGWVKVFKAAGVEVF